MKFLDNLGLATQLAGILLSPPIVGVLMGRWLDQRLGSDPLWTASLLILGVLAGLWSMYKHLKGIGDE